MYVVLASGPCTPWDESWEHAPHKSGANLKEKCASLHFADRGLGRLLDFALLCNRAKNCNAGHVRSV